MTHTKGPWYTENYSGIWMLQSKSGYLPSINLLDEEDCNEAMGNAKLIAAAPELIELAYEFRVVINHLSGRMGKQMEINVNDLIDSAIKKATI